VPRRPPHVWKDPDIILKEYDVSHRLSVSSYISIFGPFSRNSSLPRHSRLVHLLLGAASAMIEGSGTATSTRSFTAIEKLTELSPRGG
jgi:hypothetical protein